VIQPNGIFLSQSTSIAGVDALRDLHVEKLNLSIEESSTLNGRHAADSRDGFLRPRERWRFMSS
jgi:hypothetical protein